MAILLSSPTDDPVAWWAALESHLGPVDLRVWPDALGDVAEVEFALVWEHPPGSLKRFPNLRVIFSLGAGVEHLLADTALPEGVPVVRLVDAHLTRDMVEYVTAWVLYFHRAHHRYRAHQAEALWRPLPPVAATARTVGILGLGELGGAAAAALARLGFAVRGWSRSPKSLAGIACFHGREGLGAFLGGVDILVCLLPLTGETLGIVDRDLLRRLAPGACLINAARGAHVVDADLVAALDAGHIAGAALDVFHGEPLPPRHAFWHHPGIAITPHVASLTDPHSAAGEIADGIRRFRAGFLPRNVVDVARGY